MRDSRRHRQLFRDADGSRESLRDDRRGNTIPLSGRDQSERRSVGFAWLAKVSKVAADGPQVAQSGCFIYSFTFLLCDDHLSSFGFCRLFSAP